MPLRAIQPLRRPGAVPQQSGTGYRKHTPFAQPPARALRANKGENTPATKRGRPSRSAEPSLTTGRTPLWSAAPGPRAPTGGRAALRRLPSLAHRRRQEGAKARRTELRAAVSETELEHARYDLQRGPRRD